LTIPKDYSLFIEVKEGGRLDFMADYNPECLPKKKVRVIDATYKG
jgi:hypothetical protein